MNHSISTQLLAQLVSVCEELSLARNMDMVMSVVRRAARALTGADGATFVLLDHRSEGDFCYYADEDAIGPLWKGERFPVSSCVSGWAMLNKTTAVIGDIYNDPRIPVDLYEPTFVRSLVMAPIRRNDPLGAVGTYWKEKRSPTEEEVRILEALTDITAVTIELVRVYQDLEARVLDRTAQLEERDRQQRANITYAHRVQRAMLPSAELMQELLPQHFVIHEPKDIVSGDFYWLARREDKVLFAVADCTGHGVTGALLSTMCSNQLDRAVNEFGFTDPGAVLDITRELVLERLTRNEVVTDGMDISLCMIDRSAGNISWSGANSDLLFVSGGAVHELKAHRQPIGHTDSSSRFPTHCLRLSRGDTIYLMSDGFVDQFGGPLGKKFLSRALRELLLAVDHLSMDGRKKHIQDTFRLWKGDHDQVDDVTLIGIRL
ncbi:MAG TPA: SpoIIE family protein phosphatase [Flavobacteriales bacterium]|nr:SpoIIE family protein phosphatase [Flavobacteriales bacterium]